MSACVLLYIMTSIKSGKTRGAGEEEKEVEVEVVIHLIFWVSLSQHEASSLSWRKVCTGLDWAGVVSYYLSISVILTSA